MKLQTPSSKHQRTTKLQTSMEQRGGIGACDLELLWKLKTFQHWSCTPKRAVSGNPDLSDGMMKPDKSSCGSRASAARPGEDKRASQRGGFFPLTPALSRWERVKPALPGVQSTQVGFPLREARCSLSPRERVRVRGNGANDLPACWTNSRTINESSGRVMGFSQRPV